MSHRLDAYREPIAVLAAFILATVLFTYPQAWNLNRAVGPHYDALFSVWRLSWIAHALVSAPTHLFDANIFAPNPHTLAYSDAILLPGTLAAPFIAAGTSAVVIYNLLVLACFVASASCMYVLVRSLTASPAAAAFSGVAFAFSPFRFAHFPQLELLWDWPIPLAIWLLYRVRQWGRRRDAIWLGLVLAAQVYGSIYFGVLLSLMLAVLSAFYLWSSRIPLRRHVYLLALAALSAAVVVLPYLLVYRGVAQEIGTRTLDEVRLWSPTWKRFLETPEQNWLYGRLVLDASLEMCLFPGWSTLFLAAVGFLSGGWPDNRLRLAFAIALLLALDLTRGTNGLLYGHAFRVLWPLHGLRVPARMFVIVSAMLAIAAGFGLARLVSLCRRRVFRGAVITIGLSVAVTEFASTPVALLTVPAHVPVVYHSLRQQPPSTVLEWPFPRPWSIGESVAPIYMYYSTTHWQTLVNGYSGFHPPSYLALLSSLDGFPNPRTIAMLRDRHVNFVVLHGELEPDTYTSVRDRLASVPGVELVAWDRLLEGEVTLFRIR